MTKALTIYDQFDELERAAIALQQSGYFPDVKSKAQAIVKVMAGAELGLPAFASMSGIHIIQGKPVLGANVLATLVKNDPRYDYRIIVSSNETCELTFYEDGKEAGDVAFTIDEAKAAGLTGKDNWKKWPSDMLFARAISRGTRRYAPGVFGGSPVYTPEEMGADTDEEGNVIVDVEAVEVNERYEVEPEPSNGREWPKETIDTILTLEYAGAVPHAVNILNMSQELDPGKHDTETCVRWVKAYKTRRANDIDASTAAIDTDAAFLAYQKDGDE